MKKNTKKNKKILVVEDDIATMQLLGEKLGEQGFLTIMAEDGERALEIALKERPDLILLDILLPKMDGMEMLGKLRKNTWGSNVPVIILTNIDDFSTINEALGNHVYDYLIKTDWRLGDVLERIKEKLAIAQS